MPFTCDGYALVPFLPEKAELETLRVQRGPDPPESATAHEGGWREEAWAEEPFPNYDAEPVMRYASE